MRVLIVDDDDDLRTILVVTLEAEGHEVVAACDGAQALRALYTQPQFDVVLLDLIMPDLDGYDLIRLRNLDADLRRVPVIVISAVDQKRVHGGLEGVALVFDKPVDVRRLLQILPHFVAR